MSDFIPRAKLVTVSFSQSTQAIWTRLMLSSSLNQECRVQSQHKYCSGDSCHNTSLPSWKGGIEPNNDWKLPSPRCDFAHAFSQRPRNGDTSSSSRLPDHLTKPTNPQPDHFEEFAGQCPGALPVSIEPRHYRYCQAWLPRMWRNSLTPWTFLALKFILAFFHRRCHLMF